MTIQQITNSIKNRAKKIYKWCGDNLGTIIVVSAGIFIATAVYLKTKSKKDQAKKQPETNRQEAQPKPVVHVHEHWVYNITPLLEGIGSLLNSVGEYIKSKSNAVVAEELSFDNVMMGVPVAPPSEKQIIEANMSLLNSSHRISGSNKIKQNNKYLVTKNILDLAVGGNSEKKILKTDYDFLSVALDANLSNLPKKLNDENNPEFEQLIHKINAHKALQVQSKLMLTSFWQRMYHWSNAKYCLNPNAPEIEIVKPIVKQETATPVRLEEEDDGAGIYPKPRKQAKRDLSPSAPRLKATVV